MLWSTVRGLLLAVALSGSLAACGVRAPVRDATYGLLDAIQNPPPNDTLARDLRVLVQTYVERALRAGPPEDLSKIAGRITAEVLKATGEAAPEERKLVGSMVSEALRSSLVTLEQELPALERTGARLAPALERGAGEAGARLLHGAMDTSVTQLEQQVGGTGEGPLAQALLAMARRTAGATVRGATEAARAEMAACQSGEAPGCGVDVVRSMSRSMVIGVLDGVRHEVGLWLLVLAFCLGLALAGAAAGVAHVLRHPRAILLRAPPPRRTLRSGAGARRGSR
jgi:hypothetical protein